MDAGRRAMIDGQRSPMRRDPTSPIKDPSNRITKPSRPTAAKTSGNRAKYWTQDEQERQFVADEDKFVLKQSKKKADIRVREGRAKPIDFLAFTLRFIDLERDVWDDEEADSNIDVPTPTDLITSLNLDQLKELDTDISSYLTLETRAQNRDYWKAVRSLCASQRASLAPQASEGRVVGSVSSDIDRILAPKNLGQLEALEKQIKAKLRSDEDIDTDYWEQLLKSLNVWKAKATLKSISEDIARSRKQQVPSAKAPKVHAGATEPTKTDAVAAEQQQPSPKHDLQGQQAVSKPSNATSAAPPGTERFAQSGHEDLSKTTKALYDREVARGLSENEEVFTAEESVSSLQPKWADKYTARKPRYFNRVLMGYEWNKYNQTHYDHDNPPPKVVQGYKFNIFYPELIDVTKTPTFKIVREHGRRRGESFAEAGEEDTCLIRFTAGPPYEDIAFRIVDREWDYSAKRDRGYRSSFDKGILQLHFQFKRVFYRK